jgi:hypothetical protein
LHHDVRHGSDIVVWYLFMEEVTHRIDKYSSGNTPSQRFREFFRDESEVKTLFVGMPFDSAKPFCERLRVTVLAAGADFRAATNGVPRRICPLD